MSPIIEVAIGMIFIYSLLSIMVTQINTLILNVLNLRAKQLKEGLMNLVSDREMQAKILAHPLIRMVEDTVRPEEKLRRQEQKDIAESRPTKVTYIAPGTFVEALLSLLTAESDTSIFQPLEDAVNALPNNDQKVLLRESLRDFRSFGTTDTRTLRAYILELPNETHKQVLSYALEEVENALGRLPAKNGQLIPLLEGIRKIKDPAFQDALKSILVTAHNLEDARAKLQNWFNDGMNRISELYTRRIQYISLAVGFILALVLNADSLQLASAFWDDPALRQSVATVAKRNLNELEREVVQSTESTPPPTLPELESEAELQAQAQAAVNQSAQEVNQTVQELIDLQLPIGWEYTTVSDELVATSQLAGLPDPRRNLRNLWNMLPGNSADWLGNLARKLIGFIVTMVAVAQGAPFWFDLLRRISMPGGGGSASQPTSVTVNLKGNSLLDEDKGQG